MNIYGASGHAKVIIDIINSRMEEIHTIYDDNPVITGIYDYPVVHQFSPEALRKKTLIAIGNNEIRRKIAQKFAGPFHRAVSHATAVVDDSVEMGIGTVVMANATINADTIIGDHCIINTSCVVEHDCVLDKFVHISPNATIAGGTKIGEGTHVGIGALVIPGIKIGKWCVIGAGAVVIEDIPDYATVVGNPAKIIKFRSKLDE